MHKIPVQYPPPRYTPFPTPSSQVPLHFKPQPPTNAVLNSLVLFPHCSSLHTSVEVSLALFHLPSICTVCSFIRLFMGAQNKYNISESLHRRSDLQRKYCYSFLIVAYHFLVFSFMPYLTLFTDVKKTKSKNFHVLFSTITLPSRMKFIS